MFKSSGNPAMPHARMKPGFYLRSSTSARGEGGGCHPFSGFSRNASLLSKLSFSGPTGTRLVLGTKLCTMLSEILYRVQEEEEILTASSLTSSLLRLEGFHGEKAMNV